jgi:hypothetical protein
VVYSARSGQLRVSSQLMGGLGSWDGGVVVSFAPVGVVIAVAAARMRSRALERSEVPDPKLLKARSKIIGFESISLGRRPQPSPLSTFVRLLCISYPGISFS